MPRKKTVSSTFGPKRADQLARLAIEIGCRAPERISTYETRIPASMVGEIREVLENAGVDWRKLHREQRERLREAKALVHQHQIRERSDQDRD